MICVAILNQSIYVLDLCMDNSKISVVAQTTFYWIALVTTHALQFINGMTNENSHVTNNSDYKQDQNTFSTINSGYVLGSARTCHEADINHDHLHILYPYDD